MNANFDNEFKHEAKKLEILIQSYESKLKQVLEKQRRFENEYSEYKKKRFQRQKKIESYERELIRLDNYINTLIGNKSDLEYKLVNLKVLGKMSRTMEMININLNIMLQKK